METLVDTIIPFGRNSVKENGWLLGIFFPTFTWMASKLLNNLWNSR